MLDLFAGELGWSAIFAARGWKVTAVDVKGPRRDIPKGVEFVQEDVANFGSSHGGWIYLDGCYDSAEKFDFVCASPPCEEFSVHGMKHFHPNPKYPQLGIKLFNHTRSICEESGVPYVIENVRAAQQFVGKAVHHVGPYFLWGSGAPPILPQGINKGIKMDRAWCQELGGYGSAKRQMQTAGFATIPPELANCVAEYAERLLEAKVTA